MLKAKFKQFIFLVVAMAFISPIVGLTEEIGEDGIESSSTSENLLEQKYQDVLTQWSKQYEESPSYSQTIKPESMVEKANLQTQDDYNQPVVELSEGSGITFEVTVPKTALYQFSLDYYSLSDSLIDAEFSIKVNNTYPFYESRRIIAPSTWVNVSNSFEKNSSGNELIPEQKTKPTWSNLAIQDANFLEKNASLFLLKEGKNTVSVQNTSGKMLLGEFTIQSPQAIPSYNTYREQQKERSNGVLIVQEAERTTEKNNSYIRPYAIKSVDVEPYSSKETLLNALGGSSWSKSGQSVTWTIDVPADGNYEITLKMNQKEKENSPVFRTISIDGEVSFAELNSYRFDPTTNWTNTTLGKKDVPYFFYLTKGEHTLTMAATAAPVAKVLYGLEKTMDEISDLGLEIKKLTGNQSDSNREWKLQEYIPTVNEKFEVWNKELQQQKKDLVSIYGAKGKKAQELIQLQIIIDKLNKLAEKVDELPNKLADLSEGSSSVTQSLANLQSLLKNQPLSLDRIYIHGSEAKLPSPTKDFINHTSGKVNEFIHSFSAQTYDTSNVEADTLEVWVARSQQYVELMQNMVDSTFTKETGIKVKFSVMPNEQKLILANSSGQQPDVALGVSVGMPYELAIRGAALDLSQFSDFKEYIHHFSPGAFTPMMLDDKVYGLPETQDFYVQFSRKDILSKLEIESPNNWNEVVSILPELQRYGLNYFVPLSGSAGTKAFMFTAPFIYQFGGELYTEDGTETAIDQEKSLEGLQFMTDLYSLYSLPMQVPNFYNSFRYGTLPIGVSNFETYVKLMSAAPEIANSWELSLYPGVVQEDGSVSRWSTGSAQSAMIFEKSKKKEEAWALVKWWLGTKTQSDFATNLQTIYGPEYMWNTANLDAFAQLPWPEEHKKVILEQWAYLKEVPKTPGSYILEREISNVWTDVVFNGVNLRASVDDRTIIIDREIKRKLEEFGYMKGNKVIKPYDVPKMETVEAWMNEKN